MAHIGIIGSGFGGLSAAIHCAHHGHHVSVYEKNEQLGGRASMLESNGFRWDMGPSWYLMPDIFEEFFKQFGLQRKDYIDISPLAPSYKIYFKHSDKVVDIYSDVEKNRPVFESLEPGSTEQVYAYLEKAAYQYEIAMREFVPKNYDSILDFFTWRMMTEGRKMDVFGNLHTYVTRYFSTPEMQKIMEYALVFLGTAPKDAPAMYNIMSHVDFNGGVRYPTGGIRAIIDALITIAKEKGVIFHTHTPIERIIVDKKYATGIVTHTGSIIQHDAIISNADYRFTETSLLEKPWQTYPTNYRQKKVMAPSGFILYLGIAGEMKGLDHHTLFFSNDRDKNFEEIFSTKQEPSDPSFYICCPSKTDTTVAPPGYENIFVLVPFPTNVVLSAEQQQAYRKKILQDIEEHIGYSFQDRIIEEHYFGPEHFMQRYNAFQGSALGLAHTLQQTALFRPNTKSKKVKNLFYAGGYTNPGIGMPMCLISGGLAYKRIQTLFG